jgi:hypothetical protein
MSPAVAAPAAAELRFRVAAWAAIAPGCSSPADWQAWAQGQTVTVADHATEPAPPLAAAIPPLLRRRADHLGRLLLEVLTRLPACAGPQPTVVASRNGELARSVALLHELAATAALSPQGFGMAVHNAIAGLYTIATGNHGAVSAVAAGRDSAWYGLLEALLLLADGAPAVTLAIGDVGLPPEYAAFADGPEPPHALALRLVPGDDHGLAFRGAAAVTPGAALAADLPAGLALLRGLLDGRGASSADGRFALACLRPVAP